MDFGETGKEGITVISVRGESGRNEGRMEEQEGYFEGKNDRAG